MGKKIRVLVACPSPTDGTSLYRGMGPFSVLKKQFDDEIEVTPGGMNTSDYTWDKLSMHDVLFFQRPTIPSHAQIIDQALQKHMPVWIDYDDDLLSVPKDNPTYPLYSNPQNKMAITQCLQKANLVSVSTQHIKNTYSQYTKAIQVIPNALDNTELARRNLIPPMKDRKKVVLWRGSSTHVGDLLHFKDDILACYEKNPDWRFFFLGYEPFFITDHMKPERYMTAPFDNHMKYFALLQTLAAPIHIVPLPKTQFNQSKSNIAWIEGTLAGSAVITPDFESWNDGGTITYGSDPKDSHPSFREVLDNAMAGRTDLEWHQEQSWLTVQQHLTLTKVNELRRVCLQKLISFSNTYKESFGIKPLRSETAQAPESQMTQ